MREQHCFEIKRYHSYGDRHACPNEADDLSFRGLSVPSFCLFMQQKITFDSV